MIPKDVLITAADDPTTIEQAARLWVFADEARAAVPFEGQYADEQATGFVETLRRPGAWLAVAWAGDELVGLVGGFPADDDDGNPAAGVSYLAWLAVAPDRWGSGIGDRLLAHAEQHAAVSGSVALTLFVHADNARARSVYERRTWSVTGRTQRTPLTDESLVEYRIDLPPRPAQQAVQP